MFYLYPLSEITDNTTKALVTLIPAESKPLIAKGVAIMPEVKKALETGIIIIAHGTINLWDASPGFSYHIHRLYEFTSDIVCYQRDVNL